MDYAVMKKKLNSFKMPNGVFRKISGEMLIELLRAWEGYTGPMDDFARQIGVRKSQLGPIIHKARKIAKDSDDGDFKEVKVSEPGESTLPPCKGIELIWDNGKILRFSEVEVLLDFFKKIA